MSRAYLLLGGNVGDRKRALEKAISEIEKHIGKILEKSSVYKTKAWGLEQQPDFLNQAILTETTLSPQKLMNEILKIEKLLGRKRTGKKWSERVIDIDLLFYDDLILGEKNLKIPHPYLHLRKFTLKPLNEIAPGFMHPVLKKTISELLEKCEDKLKVTPYNSQTYQ